MAISLVKEQYVIQREIVKESSNFGYDYEVYLKDSNFFWVGHSLGCKYIALLEFLSGEWGQIIQDIKICASDKSRYTNTIEFIETLALDLDLEKRKTEIATEKYVGEKAKIKNLFIKGQSSLLIAPAISDTKSAIPIQFLAKLIDRFGWGVNPNVEQTQCLIKYSELFNLIALICFKQDKVAKNTCEWLAEKLNSKNEQAQNKPLPIPLEQLCGKHLEPVGIKVGHYIVDLNPLDKFIKPIEDRKLESIAIQLLKELEVREKAMEQENQVKFNA